MTKASICASTIFLCVCELSPILNFTALSYSKGPQPTPETLSFTDWAFPSDMAPIVNLIMDHVVCSYVMEVISYVFRYFMKLF